MLYRGGYQRRPIGRSEYDIRHECPDGLPIDHGLIPDVRVEDATCNRLYVTRSVIFRLKSGHITQRTICAS